MAVRIPPHNLDAEKAVLGSVMLKPDTMNEIVDLVNLNSFYADKHSHIFQAMFELHSKGEPIDIVSVSNKLKEKDILEKIGGRAYLISLSEGVPASTNVKHYAYIVHKNHLLRKLTTVGEEIAELGFSEPEDLDKTLDDAERLVREATNASGSNRSIVSIRQSLADTWEQLERLSENTDELRGVPTGYKELDNLLAGLQKSDLIILAARPSVGKTTLALDMVRHAASKAKVPTAIFSLEMSAQQLTQRMLAAESRVNAWKLRVGRVSSDNEFSQIRDALDELSKAPIYIDDQAGNNINHMRSVARKLKREFGLGLIIIDYLQLMTTSKAHDSMVNQVTEISRSLKGLARELDVPVLALSQLSRAIESRGGKPRLSDLRDSGSIEQDADVVMFIHREDRTGTRTEEESNGITEILVEKHRNGPLGKVQLFFDEKSSTFLPIERNTEGFEAMMPDKEVDQAFDDF